MDAPFVEGLFEGSNSETDLFVDIGGGIGHQCAALRAIMPVDRGRIYLQDQEALVQSALRTDGVINIATDFWQEQPVIGSFLSDS